MVSAAGCIPHCADRRLDVGITRRTIEERLSEHALGISHGDTKSRRAVTLLHQKHHDRVSDAVAAELRIKGWSGTKKIACIRGDFDALHAVAKRRGKAVEHDPSSFDAAAPRPAWDEGS